MDEIKKIFKKHTIPEGDPELTMFDTDAIIKDLKVYCDKQSRGARIAELQRTIAYFDDEGRESKKVLKAFENNRIKALESAPIKDGSRK